MQHVLLLLYAAQGITTGPQPPHRTLVVCGRLGSALVTTQGPRAGSLEGGLRQARPCTGCRSDQPCNSMWHASFLSHEGDICHMLLQGW